MLFHHQRRSEEYGKKQKSFSQTANPAVGGVRIGKLPIMHFVNSGIDYCTVFGATPDVAEQGSFPPPPLENRLPPRLVRPQVLLGVVSIFQVLRQLYPSYGIK